MEELPEVETAKTLMTEAMSWSVMNWLRDTKRGRKTADQVNAVLDQMSQPIQERGPDPVGAAYQALA
jgi:hypothetical protein